MRRGFTMIELIFVIVIIGILAVIAIPKLSATRDDAKLVTEMQNLSTCVQDIGAVYTAKGEEGDADDISSCKALTCFKIEDSGGNDGNITVKKADTITGNYCDDAFAQAEKKNLYDTTANEKEISFGGSKVAF